MLWKFLHIFTFLTFFRYSKLSQINKDENGEGMNQSFNFKASIWNQRETIFQIYKEKQALEFDWIDFKSLELIS